MSSLEDEEQIQRQTQSQAEFDYSGLEAYELLLGINNDTERPEELECSQRIVKQLNEEEEESIQMSQASSY